MPALHASYAIPFVFTPVKLYGRVLIDGGVISPLSVEVAKMNSVFKHHQKMKLKRLEVDENRC